VLVEGVKLHYVEGGSGQPLVLLHGNDGTLKDFTMSIFDRLASQYQTLAFDRPGHGESDSPKHTVATPEIQAYLIHLALKKLGIVRPLLVAHSWSGSVALTYALQYPKDLSGIVLLGGMAYETKESNPKPSYYAMQVPIIRNIAGIVCQKSARHDVEKQLDQAFSPDVTPSAYKQQFIASLFRQSQMEAASRDEITLNPSLKRISLDYDKIDVPVVIVYGDRDQVVPAKLHSLRLHQAIPKSKLIVVQNAGHELQFTRPTEVMNAIEMAEQTSATWTPNSAALTAGRSDVRLH
jgi:pimeloyl-ACP methyl ester carboxylesterase